MIVHPLIHICVHIYSYCRRYAEQLLDILIAGGQLAPGGKIESSVRASVCVFTCEPMVEALKEHIQVSGSVSSL